MMRNNRVPDFARLLTNYEKRCAHSLNAPLVMTVSFLIRWVKYLKISYRKTGF
jgi:hypothetical protein